MILSLALVHRNVGPAFRVLPRFEPGTTKRIDARFLPPSRQPAGIVRATIDDGESIWQPASWLVLAISSVLGSTVTVAIGLVFQAFLGK